MSDAVDTSKEAVEETWDRCEKSSRVIGLSEDDVDLYDIDAMREGHWELYELCKALQSERDQLRREVDEARDKALDEAALMAEECKPDRPLQARAKASQIADEIRALKSAPAQRPGDMSSQGMPITFTYTNWRGETAQRTAVPKSLWFGVTDWHPEPGWLMTAHDLEKAADRDFALDDCAFSAPRQTVQEAARVLLGNDEVIVGLAKKSAARAYDRGYKFDPEFTMRHSGTCSEYVHNNWEKYLQGAEGAVLDLLDIALEGQARP